MKRYKAGPIEAIRTIEGVQLLRHVKEKGDWKLATTLRPADLPRAVMVLNRCYEESVLRVER